MTGDVNVNTEKEGSTEGKAAGRRRKKEGNFFFFFFLRRRDNKIYLLDGSILRALEGLTAVNISGLLLLSACFSHWTVTAKYFPGAILTVLQVIHEKYPWNDWNRFY